MQLLIALTKRMEWFRDALQQSLEPNGIAPFTPAQLIVISKIASGEHRAINIARHLGVSRQAVSQILAELERRGVITVEKDDADGRSRIVKFKDKFEDNGNTCASILATLEDELGRRIGLRRLANLRDALDGEWGEAPIVEGPGERPGPVDAAADQPVRRTPRADGDRTAILSLSGVRGTGVHGANSAKARIRRD